MPIVKMSNPFPVTGADECGHVPDFDLDEATAAERRRCLLALLPILTVVENGAPPHVVAIMAVTIRQVLDLCPVHATESQEKKALAALSLTSRDLDTLKGSGLGLALDPLNTNRASA